MQVIEPRCMSYCSSNAYLSRIPGTSYYRRINKRQTTFMIIISKLSASKLIN